jgi:hypothetical protein
LQSLFKNICYGALQSFFAMMYNFPARITVALKTGPSDGLPTFSQRDLEGTFEAFLAVAKLHEPADRLQIWFENLLRPWIPGFVEAALELQRKRDEEWAKPKQPHSKTAEKKHTAKLLERRPAGKADFIWSLCVIYPTIRVSHFWSAGDARMCVHPRAGIGTGKLVCRIDQRISCW